MYKFGKEDKRALLKVASSVSANLAAAWFALAFIVPNFGPLTEIRNVLLLILDISSGILFFIIAFKLERKI